MLIAWSDEEIELVRNSTHLTPKELLKVLEPVSAKIGARRTLNSLHKKLRTLEVKINTGNRHKWQPEEIEYLQKHYRKKPISALAKYFNVTPRSIMNAAFRYCIIPPERRPKNANIGRPPKEPMVQETPWKKHLLEIYAVAEWLDEHGIEVEIKTKAELMAVFREGNADYQDEALALYNKFLEAGEFSDHIHIDLFDEDGPWSPKTKNGYVMKIGCRPIINDTYYGNDQMYSGDIEEAELENMETS